MLTNIFMVRHAQSDTRIREDSIRPLTPKGLVDAKRVSETLMSMNISKIFSSPYLRTVQTVQHFAKSQKLSICQMDDFRERAVGGWVDDFQAFTRKQWEDFTFKLEGGESLKEVQERNIKALLQLKKENEGLNIAAGTHGTEIISIDTAITAGERVFDTIVAVHEKALNSLVPPCGNCRQMGKMLDPASPDLIIGVSKEMR